MSIYEARLQEDLDRIRDGIAEVAAQVETALKQAADALLRQDKPLANQVVLGDFPINRAIRALDRQCHYVIARHLPSAGHLRYISSVMRMTIALERIGDYAVTIAREAKTVTQPLGEDLARAYERMADEAFSMLRQAVQAFNDRNADLARGTMGYAYQVDHTFTDAFDLLLRKGEAGDYGVQDLFGILIAFNRLERVSDQAKNICEETVFAVTGETKQPKVYRILFLESADDCRSQMAVAIGRKAYPDSATYVSGGQTPAAQVDASCAAFMADYGYDLTASAPRAVKDIPEGWKDHHVIVSLDGPAEAYLDEIPFHTITLHWDVPPPPAADSSAEVKRAAFETLHQHLSGELRGLMEQLHGAEAA